MDEKCARGQLPVVRLALKKEKCVRNAGVTTNTADTIIEYVKKTYGCLPQEYVVAVGFDPQMRPLGVFEVHAGGIASTMVDPKVLFSGLLLMGASAFVLVHNHPSGDGEPSADDVAMTRQMKAASKTLTLQLLDHFIVTGSGYTSFLSRGLLPVG